MQLRPVMKRSCVKHGGKLNKIVTIQLTGMLVLYLSLGENYL